MHGTYPCRGGGFCTGIFPQRKIPHGENPAPVSKNQTENSAPPKSSVLGNKKDPQTAITKITGNTNIWHMKNLKNPAELTTTIFQILVDNERLGADETPVHYFREMRDIREEALEKKTQKHAIFLRLV